MRFLWKTALRSRNGDCFIENVLSINLFLATWVSFSIDGVDNLCFLSFLESGCGQELGLWREKGRLGDNQYTQRWSQSIETTRWLAGYRLDPTRSAVFRDDSLTSNYVKSALDTRIPKKVLEKRTLDSFPSSSYPTKLRINTILTRILFCRIYFCNA